MKIDVSSALPTIGLIAVLAMAPVAPEAGNTLFLTMAGLGLLLAWPRAWAERRRPIIWMPLVAFVLVGAAYFFSAGIEGLAGLAYFAPILAIWPFIAMLRGVDTGPYSGLVALLSVSGVAGAAFLAVIEVQQTGTGRAGEMVANPIHFADVALLVSFCALAGLGATRDLRRYLLLAVPLVALLPVVLSGTRGAMVAFPLMVAAGLTVAAITRLVPRRLVLVSLLGGIVLTGIFLAVGGSQVSSVQRLVTEVYEILEHGGPTDWSSSLRVDMYTGGLRAFLEAPLFGHGPIAFTTAASALADRPFDAVPHLHNDIVDMAASAGLFGLVAFCLLISAPFMEALKTAPSSGRSAILALAATLITGFVVMGLTNAMFGILTITTTFAAICVIIGMLCSPQPMDEEGNVEQAPSTGAD